LNKGKQLKHFNQEKYIEKCTECIYCLAAELFCFILNQNCDPDHENCMHTPRKKREKPDKNQGELF